MIEDRELCPRCGAENWDGEHDREGNLWSVCLSCSYFALYRTAKQEAADAARWRAKYATPPGDGGE